MGLLKLTESERLEILKQKLIGLYPQIDIVISCFDIQIQSEVQKAIDTLQDSVKQKIVILINSAGLAAGRDIIQEGKTDDWEQMIDTNVKGLLYLSKEIIKCIST